MSEQVVTGAELVELSELKPYPKNARRGDVGMIAESLKAHGQYRPIVVNRRNSQVLAGWHTAMAAKSLGWKEVAVTWVDVDDESAARIVLADNRTSDLANYQEDALGELLRQITDLFGTGFDQSTLDYLEGLFDGANRSFSAGSDEEATEKSNKTVVQEAVKVKVGPYVQFVVEADPFAAWLAYLMDSVEQQKPLAVRKVRELLGLPEPEKSERKRSKPKQPESEPEYAALSAELVDVDRLHVLEGNAREGDVGAIAESLLVNGQYRPVVARRDGTVLVGNHTFTAVKLLGWKQIAVVWVDVDDEQAVKIALVDNRTSDVATYDDARLSALLTELASWEGTGFDGDDVDDLLSGGLVRPPIPQQVSSTNVVVNVGEIRQRVATPVYQAWANQLPFDGAEIEVASRLGLPLDACWLGEARLKDGSEENV